MSTRVGRAIRQGLLRTGLERYLAELLPFIPPRLVPSRILPENSEFPAQCSRRVRRRGVNFTLDPSDYIEWLVYFGLQEPGRSALLRLIKRGDTIVDVGANIGEVSLRAARIVGSRGRVLALEPSPLLFAKLRANQMLNPRLRVVAVPCAAGESRTRVQLSTPHARNRGGTRVAPAGAGNGAEVDVIPLDELLADHGFQNVDLIKIDVEGYEAQVLRGALRTLSSSRRPKLFVEIDEQNLRDQRSSTFEILEILRATRYRTRDAVTGALLDGASRNHAPHFELVATPE